MDALESAAYGITSSASSNQIFRMREVAIREGSPKNKFKRRNPPSCSKLVTVSEQHRVLLAAGYQVAQAERFGHFSTADGYHHFQHGGLPRTYTKASGKVVTEVLVQAFRHPPSSTPVSPGPAQIYASPRMGLKDKRYRSTTGINHEPSFPDRLAHALKALRPGILSHSSSSSAAFKSKSVVVDADDVVYYVNTDRCSTAESTGSSRSVVTPERPPTSGAPKAGGSSSDERHGYLQQRKPRQYFSKHCSPSQHNLYERSEMSPEPMPLKDLKTLDQLRQLYKSVPNFSSFEEEDEAPPTTASKELYLSTRSANSDRQSDSPHESLHRSTTSSANCRESPACTNTTFTTYSSTGSASTTSTRSPTDSGFSSTSRYVTNLSPPSTPPKPPPLPPLPAKSINQKGHTRSMVKLDPFCSDPPPKPSRASVRHEPTVVVVNGTDTLGDAVKPASVSASSDSSHRPKLPSISAENPRVTSNISLALSSTDDSNPSAHAFGVPERQGSHFASTPGLFPLREYDMRKTLLRSLPESDFKRIADDAFTSLSLSVHKPLTKIAVEFGRLSHALVKCTPNDVKTATKLILPEAVAENCVKAGMQATSLYALSGTGALRTSMSRRAGLNVPVGKINQWIVDIGYVAAITDPAIVFFAAVAESFVEAAARTLLAKLDVDESLNAARMGAFVKDGDLLEFLRISSYVPTADDASCARSPEALRLILDRSYHLVLQKKAGAGSRSSASPPVQSLLTPDAMDAFFHYVKCKGSGCSCHLQAVGSKAMRTIAEWLRIMLIFMEHRHGTAINRDDVIQTARILLGTVDFPPPTASSVLTVPPASGSDKNAQAKKRRDLGFSLLAAAIPEQTSEAFSMLGPLRHRTRNEYGLTALAQAVLTRNKDATDLLIALGVDVSFPVPQHVTSDGSQRSEEPALLSADFAGWTPLTWVVALQDHATMTKIIEAAADVDEPYMTRETPLQICAVVGNAAIAERLLSCGADAFASSVSYDSLKCNFRSIGTPSPLALTAANGHYELFRRLLKQVGSACNQGQKEMSLGDFLKENGGSVANASPSSSSHGSSVFDGLPKTQQRALLEAVYYAVETSRFPIVKELRKYGVPWNGYTWTYGLEVAVANKQRPEVQQFLSDFNMRFADDFNSDVVESLATALFEIVRNECHLPDGDCSTVANIVARLHHRFAHSSRSSTFDSTSNATDSSLPTHGHARPIIDPRYVDNPELSDIRFKVGEKVVYAHRIVLANASDEFRRLLDKPNGQVSIENVSYEVFKLLMEHMYGNTASCLERLSKEGLSRQLEVLDAAKTYGLSHLESDCEKLARAQISHSTVVRVYHLAKRCRSVGLLDAAESYILKHFSSMLDDARLRSLLRQPAASDGSDLSSRLAARLTAAFNGGASTKD